MHNGDKSPLTFEDVDVTCAGEWMPWLNDLIHESFPPEERRPAANILEKHSSGAIRLRLAKSTNTQEYAGFYTVWNLHSCMFGEHTAIAPQYRGKGLFQFLFQDMIRLCPNKPFLGEVEWPTTPESKRRVAIFRKLGLQMLSYKDYVQPSYAPEVPQVPLMLMSDWDDAFWTTEKLMAAISEIRKVVYRVN